MDSDNSDLDMGRVQDYEIEFPDEESDAVGSDNEAQDASDDDIDDPDVDANILLQDTTDDSSADENAPQEDLWELYHRQVTLCQRKSREMREMNRRHLAVKQDLDEKDTRLRQDNKQLASLVRDLERKNEELRNPPPRRQAEPWISRLREYVPEIDPGEDPDLGEWESICGACNKQNNMSQKVRNIHPNLELHGECSDEDYTRNISNDIDGANGANGNDGDDGGIDDNNGNPNNQAGLAFRPFDFNKLPIEVQGKIFERHFVKPGLIHCLSRLDDRHPPKQRAHFPFAESGTSGLPHRFAYGTGITRTSVMKAKKPSEVLSSLLVCRRWFYIGVHAFYGMNTFAFSSLGEFGRFFKGIGRARAERIAHVELFWQGSIMPHDPRTRVNQRTLPLTWLTRSKRLQTLAIHTDESSESRTRRKHEFPRKTKNNGARTKQADMSDRYKDYTRAKIERLKPHQKLLKRTAQQPNFRGYRSMRTCHGMDYVYQLRGMQWVRFYEVHNNAGQREHIRDWSFANEINVVVTLPKQQAYASECDITNLSRLPGLPNTWRAQDQDLALVDSFYSPRMVDVDDDSDTSSARSGSPSPAPSTADTDISDLDFDFDEPRPEIIFPDEGYQSGPDMNIGQDVDADVPHKVEDSDSDNEPQNDPNAGPDEDSDGDSDNDSDGGPDDIPGGINADPGGRANPGPSPDPEPGPEPGSGSESGSEHSSDNSDAVFDNAASTTDAERANDTQLTAPESAAEGAESGEAMDQDGDDDDRESVATSGLFVRSDGPSSIRGPPSVVPSVTPSTALSTGRASLAFRGMAPPPRPNPVVIDLTADDSDDDGSSTVSSSFDSESLFVRSRRDGSTIAAHGSSSDERRRQIFVDLTADEVKREDDRSSVTSSGTKRTRDDDGGDSGKQENKRPRIAL
ncbi:hypothetical protein JX265_001218 [Neoarthrinium moseri]|uniref:DUF7730 domain-containing protein n=1 Tax=Neoarthrinium moseri TaxID=1658444 RepID=A0A9P9WXA8_9PEZI|nr:hypothetical protein JX265_001218 [Neoarthrinium moseri]